MPAFDAGATVEPLDWDFTTMPNWPKELARAKGTIKEPSDKVIGDFLDSMKSLYSDVEELGIEGIDGDDPAAVLAAIDNVTGEAYVKLMNDLASLYTGLCSGDPSLEMLLALPLRVRMKFFRWLMNEVVRPEDETSAGAQVVSIRERAATG